jgi:asparagine synthase (glutamine-hydrolysing)
MAKQHLPKNFALDRKQGFSVPMDDWIRNSNLDQLIEELPKDIFNLDFVKKLISGHGLGRANGARIFALIMLNISSFKSLS